MKRILFVDRSRMLAEPCFSVDNFSLMFSNIEEVNFTIPKTIVTKQVKAGRKVKKSLSSPHLCTK